MRRRLRLWILIGCKSNIKRILKRTPSFKIALLIVSGQKCKHGRYTNIDLSYEVNMKINEEKLRNASKAEIIKEIDLVNDELSNEMHPASGYRCLLLYDYKEKLEEELKKR